MSFTAKNGMWPVMLTPFTKEGAIDYPALEALIAWYEEKGADGLFAVCQSSEMFYLSLRERVELASFVKKTARVPVIASGHISCSAEDQIEELRQMAATGVDALIFITNRFASPSQGPEVWLENLKRVMDALPPELPLGLYECPYPYKRIVTDEELEFCAGTGRFYFLKDTCCDIERIRRRIRLTEGTPLKLFNANTATLLESLEAGGAGFSGVMASFHGDLYAWLLRNWKQYPEEARRLLAALTVCSRIEGQLYPVNAKYSLQLDGVPMERTCRVRDAADLCPLYRDEVEQLRLLSDWLRQTLPGRS